MSAVFTNQAVNNLQEMTADKAELGDLMMRLRDLRGDRDIQGHGGRSLARWGNIEVYVFPAGPFGVVLTTTPNKPETVIVTGVYRSDGDDTRAISDAVLATLKEDEPA